MTRSWRNDFPRLTFAALPVLAVVAPLALAPLLGIFALAMAWRFGWRDHLRKAALPLPALALGLFLLWAGLSAIWSPDPLFALKTIAQTMGCAAAGWLLVAILRAEKLPAASVRALAFGLLWASILLMSAEMAEHSLIAQKSIYAAWAAKTVTHMDRGTTVCVLLLWPTVIGLWCEGARRSALFVLFVVAVGVRAVARRGGQSGLADGRRRVVVGNTCSAAGRLADGRRLGPGDRAGAVGGAANSATGRQLALALANAHGPSSPDDMALCRPDDSRGAGFRGRPGSFPSDRSGAPCDAGR